MERYSAEYINGLGLTFFRRVEERDGILLLRLRGALDRHTLPGILRFREELLRESGPFDRHLLIDLAAVTHVDSAAVAALLMSLSNLQAARRRMALVNVSEPLLNILEVFKYTSLFPIYSSEPEALEGLRR